MRRHAKALQHGQSLRAGLAAALALLHQAKGHVVLHAQVGEQRKVLEHQRKSAQVRRHGAYVSPLTENPPAIGRFQPSDDFEQSAFATARGPQNRHGFAAVHLQIKARQQHPRRCARRLPVFDDMA